MSGIQPRNGLVLVKMVEKPKETRTAQGIILPPASNGPGSMTFDLAEIVSIGPGIIDAGIRVGVDDLKVGQTVLIKSGVQVDLGQRILGMIELKEKGSAVFLINQQDIYAIFDKSALASSPTLTLAQ